MEGSAPVTGTLAGLKEILPTLNDALLLRTEQFMERVYEKRRHELLDSSLFSHSVDTARLLAEFCPDEDAIVACLLQHSLKAKGVTPEVIKDTFGKTVRDIVSRVHLLSHLHTSDWRKSIDDMKIMLISVSDDIRVLLIVLAVQLQFMERLAELHPEHRVRLARQSLQLFAPVAARLGIYALKYRLERRAFPVCYATDAMHVEGQLQLLRTEHGSFLPRTADELKQYLARERIAADVMAREKQAYSIFQKMSVKSISDLMKITDLFAVRVIVPTVSDCYQVLGLLHRLGTPISHRFKDYISFPKPNGYQSLHTCIIGLPGAPKDVVVEVQIRTHEMHREAEYGVAAHWFYKEGERNTVLRSAKTMQIADVLLRQQTATEDDDSAKSSQELKLVDHIYVLTPRGDIIELPEGGTPLDFAFILHTDLGLKYKGARVNGTIASIGTKLENGDVVEILTHKHPQPALQWLEVLATPSARSKLKAFFFSHNRPQFILRGRESVNAELRTRGLPILDNDLSLFAIFDGKSLSIREREDLLVKIGMGSVRTASILRHVVRLPPPPTQQPRVRGVKDSVLKEPIVIEGAPARMPFKFARCCSPDQITPQPELLGMVTRTGIVSVHRKGCRMLRSANKARTLTVRWRAVKR
jgi:GTP pyrophosphokinase